VSGSEGRRGGGGPGGGGGGCGSLREGELFLERSGRGGGCKECGRGTGGGRGSMEGLWFMGALTRLRREKDLGRKMSGILYCSAARVLG